MAVPTVDTLAQLKTNLARNDAKLKSDLGAISMPGVYNARAGNLRRLRAAIGRAKTGGARSKFLAAGSSSVVGVGAGTGAGNLTNGRANSFAYQMAQVLNVKGIKCSTESFFGTAGEFGSNDLNTLDPRISWTGGWVNTVGTSLGGGMFSNSTTLTPMTFAPVTDFNTVRVIYSRFGGGGTFEVFADGVSQGTQSTDGANGIANVIKTVTLGKPVITIQRVSGSVNIIGIECYDTADPRIMIANAGWTGSDAAAWADVSSVRSPPRAIEYYAPDVTFVLIGNNDAVSGVSQADYETRMGVIIASAQLSGDVILLGPQDISTAQATQAAQDLLKVSRRALAQQYGCCLVDFSERLGTYAEGNALGQYADPLHMSRPPHSMLGQYLGDLLTIL